MISMNINFDDEYERNYERQRERLCLRRQMLEKQAINGGPEGFDYWADEIEKVKQEMHRLYVNLLNHREIR